MLVLSRKKEQSIVISEDIVISIMDIKGDQVKIGIEAPSSVKIYRQEVYKAIQEENKLAAAVTSIPSDFSFENLFKK